MIELVYRITWEGVNGRQDKFLGAGGCAFMDVSANVEHLLMCCCGDSGVLLLIVSNWFRTLDSSKRKV